ncbi:hypothetical protein AFLA_002952 [Aspergillus flavus NRRL3357]|nr:hypothetical protein AFLA_002952 [Aspergillus flavus NRRL3357]
MSLVRPLPRDAKERIPAVKSNEMNKMSNRKREIYPFIVRRQTLVPWNSEISNQKCLGLPIAKTLSVEQVASND